jgi:hypothetical protein
VPRANLVRPIAISSIAESSQSVEAMLLFKPIRLFGPSLDACRMAKKSLLTMAANAVFTPSAEGFSSQTTEVG